MGSRRPVQKKKKKKRRHHKGQHDYMKDAPLSDLLRQANINTYNHSVVFYDYNWQDCPGNGRSTGAYIIFVKGGPMNRDSRVT